MIDRHRLRVWRDALRYTAYAGTDAPPKRSAGLRWLRALTLIGCGLWAGFVTFSTVSVPGPAKTFNVLISVLPCLLAVRSPLWGWRLLIVGIVSTPLTLPGIAESWGWPWAPGLTVTAALVFYLVGESNDQPQLAWAGLISFSAAAPFLRDWRDAALLVLLGGILFFLGNTVHQRRLAEEERAAQQERRLAEETRAALLEERAGIARELHDVVAHHMSVLALRADSARFRFADHGKAEREAEIWQEFADLAGTAREGLTELRRLLGVLRSEEHVPPVAPQPGLGKVVELVEGVKAAGTQCELDLRGDLDTVPVGVALSVFRIVQEALSNAIQHAPGAAISVELTAGPGTVRLRIDNGPGDGPKRTEPPRGGHGLVGMRERAAMLAADLEAGERADGGFRVALTVPLDREGHLEP
ncbi:sensor histidine kinase [Amycolatopsis keratiniphila]|uniref:sensor histidine kinase n=1 Tax=Amycolatopsis keratiniphila TaxID=129921 RepID=UPI00087A0B77|nr:histidine kinase [Amycolatopsis keratiniphila]OLZ61536.1 histidine kinase [Amycolatopsis keratiniphila subsp. nogabecina]SDU18938.1 Signal transduction histidine kinase [Amycolatopsis keratiniphila]